MKILLSIKPEFADKILEGTKQLSLGNQSSKIKQLGRWWFMRRLRFKSSR